MFTRKLILAIVSARTLHNLQLTLIRMKIFSYACVFFLPLQLSFYIVRKLTCYFLYGPNLFIGTCYYLKVGKKKNFKQYSIRSHAMYKFCTLTFVSHLSTFCLYSRVSINSRRKTGKNINNKFFLVYGYDNDKHQKCSDGVVLIKDTEVDSGALFELSLIVQDPDEEIFSQYSFSYNLSFLDSVEGKNEVNTYVMKIE